jgi:hypothetical protein
VALIALPTLGNTKEEKKKLLVPTKYARRISAATTQPDQARKRPMRHFFFGGGLGKFKTSGLAIKVRFDGTEVLAALCLPGDW